MIVESALLIVSGYLLGSIPTAYLVGRWIKDLDLRRYGSGTVSGSMVWEHVARWAVVPVGLFDMFKAALPAWLGLRLELGMPVAVAAGLAAVAGHNWPVFLRFTGGRGLGSFMGVLLVVFPWGFPWMLAAGRPGHAAAVVLCFERPGDCHSAGGRHVGPNPGQAAGGQPAAPAPPGSRAAAGHSPPAVH